MRVQLGGNVSAAAFADAVADSGRDLSAFGAALARKTTTAPPVCLTTGRGKAACVFPFDYKGSR